MRRKDPFTGHPTLRRCLDCALGSGQAQPRVLCVLSLRAGPGCRTCAESEEGQQERGPGHGGCALSSASEPAAGLGPLDSYSQEGRPHANLLPSPRGLGTGPLLSGEQLGSKEESPGA